jgi:hypothetical protein
MSCRCLVDLESDLEAALIFIHLCYSEISYQHHNWNDRRSQFHEEGLYTCHITDRRLQPTQLMQTHAGPCIPNLVYIWLNRVEPSHDCFKRDDTLITSVFENHSMNCLPNMCHAPNPWLGTSKTRPSGSKSVTQTKAEPKTSNQH